LYFVFDSLNMADS